MGFLLYAAPIRADELERNEEPGRGGMPDRPVLGQVSYGAMHYPRSNLKSGEGSVRFTKQTVGGGALFPVATRGRLLINVVHRNYDYDFGGGSELGTLLQEGAYGWRLGGMYTGELTGQWSIFCSAGVRTKVEKGASRSDGRMEDGLLIFNREMADTLRLGFGAIALSRLGKQTLVVPVGTIRWEMTDRLTLQTMRGLHLIYKLNTAGTWQAGLNGEYQARYVRLNDEGRAPGGIFRERDLLSTVSLTYEPHPGLRIAAEWGYAVWREISVKDKDDQTVFRSGTDSGLSASFSARVAF